MKNGEVSSTHVTGSTNRGLGIRRNELDKAQKKIFDVFNFKTNGKKDDVLDAYELNNIITCLEANDINDIQDENLKKIYEQLAKDGITQEAILEFIKSDETIKEATVQEINGQKVLVIVREDEQTSHDGNRQLVTTEEQINSSGASQTNVTTTTEFNTAGKITQSTSDMHGGEQVIKSYLNDNGEVVLDEDGKEVLQKETIISGNTKTVRKYDDKGNMTETVTTLDKETVTVYDANGNKLYETETTKTEPQVVDEFEYVEINGERKRLPVCKTQGNKSTDYSYDAQGRKIKEITIENGKSIETSYEYSGDGQEPTQITTLDGDKLTRKAFNEDRSYVTHDLTGVTSYTDEEGKTKYKYETRVSTSYDAQNKAIEQHKVIGDNEYHVKYDGSGNTTGIIVQFDGEETNISKFCQKFNINETQFRQLNNIDAQETTMPAGKNVTVPGEMQADDARLKNRGTAAREIQKQDIAAAKALRQQAAKAECAARVTVSHTIEDELVYAYLKHKDGSIEETASWHSKYKNCDLNTAEGIAKYLYLQEGQNEITRESLDARVQQLIKANPDKFDKNGKLIRDGNGQINRTLNVPVSQSLADKWDAEAVRAQDTDTQIEEAEKSHEGKKLAKQAYTAMKWFGTDTTALDDLVNKNLNKDNIVSFLESYKEHYGESFVEAIRGESAIKGENREGTYINKLKSQLENRSKELGLDTLLLDKITTEMPTNEIDEILTRVITNINAITVLAPSQRAEQVERLNNELTGADVQMVANAAKENSDEADKILEDQLKKDGFFGDLYEGCKWYWNHQWTGLVFGETDQLDEKVREDFQTFTKKMETVQNTYNSTQDIDAFKREFTRQFGRECDTALIQQYKNLSEKIGISYTLDQYKKQFANHEYMTESELRSAFSQALKDCPELFDLNIPNSNLSNEKINAKIDDFVNSMNKDEINNSINNIMNHLRELKGNTSASTQDLMEARRNISRQIFGAENDVVFRALDYADSQQQGAGYLKMGTKLLATVLGGIATGGLGAAVVAGTSSFAIDVGDAEYRHYINDGEHMSVEEVNKSLEEALIASGLTLTGASLGKAVNELSNLSGLAKNLVLVPADITIGVTGEKLMTGEITVEGTIFTVLLTATGHIFSITPKTGKAAPEAPAKPTVPREEVTPTLTKATKNLNQDGTPTVARPSEVHVGDAKAKTITEEIGNLVAKEDVTGQQLAEARKRVDALSNRDVRSRAQSELDNRASNLSAHEKSVYDTEVRAYQKNNVERIPDKQTISPEDVRAIREYAQNITDIEGLTKLKQRIETRKTGYGNDNAAIKILDERITALQRETRTQTRVGVDVHKQLDNAISAKKGLSSLEDLKAHIQATTDPTELNRLFNKWKQVRKNCGNNRKQVDALFKEKGLDIAKANQKLSVEPTPAVPEQKAPRSAEPSAEAPKATPAEPAQPATPREVAPTPAKSATPSVEPDLTLFKDTFSPINGKNFKDLKYGDACGIINRIKGVKTTGGEYFPDNSRGISFTKDGIQYELTCCTSEPKLAIKNADGTTKAVYKINDNGTLSLMRNGSTPAVTPIERVAQPQPPVPPEQPTSQAANANVAVSSSDQPIMARLTTHEEVANAAQASQPKAPVPKAPEAPAKQATPRTLTDNELMQMNQIRSNINNARTRQDITNAQNWLDKMPECSQKTTLQEALNTKSAEISAARPAATVTQKPKYTTDTDGFIKPENYERMTPDELVAEYTRLSEYENTGEWYDLPPTPSGKIITWNTKSKYSAKSLIRDELEKRGLKLTRDYGNTNGNIPKYGYKNAEVPVDPIISRYKTENVKNLSDDELFNAIKNLESDGNGANTVRLNELKTELNNRGLVIKDGQLSYINNQAELRAQCKKAIKDNEDAMLNSEREKFQKRCDDLIDKLNAAGMTDEISMLRKGGIVHSRQQTPVAIANTSAEKSLWATVDDAVPTPTPKAAQPKAETNPTTPPAKPKDTPAEPAAVGARVVDDNVEILPVDESIMAEVVDYTPATREPNVRMVEADPALTGRDRIIEVQIENARSIRELNNQELFVNALPDSPQKIILQNKIQEKKRQLNDYQPVEYPTYEEPFGSNGYMPTDDLNNFIGAEMNYEFWGGFDSGGM